jgi:hypothetical protein
MNQHFELKQGIGSFILLLTLAAGCHDGKSAATSGADADAGAAGQSSDDGGTGGRVVGAVDAPPVPTTNDVPQPNGDVASPSLRVLPWAGFAAAVTYSFDDTQPSQTEHWPELKATGVPMTFFANPSGNWRSGYDATWTAVAAAGSEIGNHTYNHCHPDLATDCTPVGTAEEEIDQTTTYITGHFGTAAVYSFASPFGDTGWNTYAASRFLVGRGVTSGMVPATGQADWYNLPVFAVTAGQTVTNFNAGIDDTRSRGRWSIFMFHSLLPTASNWFAGVEIADVVASIEHAQSLGDIWFDTMGEVGAYARAQQMFEGLSQARTPGHGRCPSISHRARSSG